MTAHPSESTHLCPPLSHNLPRAEAVDIVSFQSARKRLIKSRSMQPNAGRAASPVVPPVTSQIQATGLSPTRGTTEDSILVAGNTKVNYKTPFHLMSLVPSPGSRLCSAIGVPKVPRVPSPPACQARCGFYARQRTLGSCGTAATQTVGSANGDATLEWSGPALLQAPGADGDHLPVGWLAWTARQGRGTASFLVRPCRSDT